MVYLTRAPWTFSRSLFERAVAAVGTDYLAHGVWDKYLAFEEEQAALLGSRSYIIALYSRVLTVPLRDLDRYYQGLKTAVSATPMLEVMSEEEATQLRSQLEEEHRQAAAVAAAAAAQEALARKEEAAAAAAAAAEAAATAAAAAPSEGAEDGAAAMSVDEAQPVEAAAAAEGEPTAAVPEVEPEAATAADAPSITEEDVKAGWLRSKLQLYSATNAELEGRRPYEEMIKRSYFHVKPLDASQVGGGGWLVGAVTGTGGEVVQWQLTTSQVVRRRLKERLWAFRDVFSRLLSARANHVLLPVASLYRRSPLSSSADQLDQIPRLHGEQGGPRCHRGHL